MSSFAVNIGSLGLQDGSIAWATDTIKARYLSSSLTPTPGMTSLTGMTAIGTDQTLGSKTQTLDGVNHRVVYSAASPVVFPSVPLGSTVGWILIYKFVTNDADSVPLWVADVSNTATTGSNMPWMINANGISYTQQQIT